MRKILIVLSLLASLAVPSPAHAEDQHRQHWAPDSDSITRVVLSDRINTSKAWRGRRRLPYWPVKEVAAAWDRSPYLEVTSTTLPCSQVANPRCIPVYRSDSEEARDKALAAYFYTINGDGSMTDAPGYVVIYTWYDIDYKGRSWILCHEVGHAWQINHHDEPGCLGRDHAPEPSAYEFSVIEAFYH